MRCLSESLRLVEDRIVDDLRSFVEQYVENVHEHIYEIGDVEEAKAQLLDQLKYLVLELHGLIREHRRRVWSSYKIDIESRSPQLLGANRLYTGQWIGRIVLRLELRESTVLVPIELVPKHEGIRQMIHELRNRSVCENLLDIMSSGFYISRDGSIIVPTTNLKLAVRELVRYDRETQLFTYIVDRFSTSTRVLLKSGIPQTIMVKPRINYSKINTLFWGISLILNYIKNMFIHEDETNILQCIQDLLNQYYMFYVTMLETLEEIDLDLVSRINLLLRFGARKFDYVSYGILYPTTKIYELYVLHKIIAMLSEKLQTNPHAVRLTTFRVGDVYIYYNSVPGKLSRIVYKLSGRLPRPDIVIKRDSKVLVIEVKYRKLNGRLNLGDVYRMLAYSVDLSRNRVLRILVACLDRDEKTPVGVKLNGTNLEVIFLTIREDFFEKDILATVVEELEV